MRNIIPAILFLSIVLVSSIACNHKENEQVKDCLSDTVSFNVDTLGFYNKHKEIHEYFDSLYKNTGFNGNVLIAQKGQILYKNVFGYSNFKTKDTLTSNTAFQLASVSKQFTAMAVMILEERGLLSYNDTVQKFFPDFPYHDISIHMLLTHRSGLPNYTYFCDKIVQDRYTPITNTQVIDSLTKHNPRWYYPPNKKFDYSNTGYMLLASIVEKASNVEFEEFVQREIFQPLKMNNSRIYNKAKHTKINSKATGYLYGKREAEDGFLNGVVGDKGVYSTIEDLYKWDQSLYTEILVKDSTIKKAFQPMGKSLTAKDNYGYGWRMFNWKQDVKVIYHAGWWQGFQSLFMHIEKDKSTVIILKNKKTPQFINKTQILDILFKTS